MLSVFFPAVCLNSEERLIYTTSIISKASIGEEGIMIDFFLTAVNIVTKLKAK